MEITYKKFKSFLKNKDYENAFHILVGMINNLDPNAIKADKLWTKIIKENESSDVIKNIEKKFYSAPKVERKEIENNFNLILDKHGENSNIAV